MATADFEEIVDSYLEAAQLLGLTRRDVELAIRQAIRIEHRCPACRHSRAPYRVRILALKRDALPIFDRSCRLANVGPSCRHFEPLELPELDPSGPEWFQPAEYDHHAVAREPAKRVRR